MDTLNCYKKHLATPDHWNFNLLDFTWILQSGHLAACPATKVLFLYDWYFDAQSGFLTDLGY